MSDSFFGFQSTLPSFEDDIAGDGLCDDLEGNYDALNDDTFGEGATSGNWESTHEQFAKEFHGHSFEDEEEGKRDISSRSLDSGFHTSERPTSPNDDLFMEQSINKLVLDDDIDDPAIMVSSKAKPINMPTGGSGLSRSLFSPSPPTLLDPVTLMSPKQNSIWSSPRAPSPDEKLKTLLNIGKTSSALPPNLVDSAIVTAIGDKTPKAPRTPAYPFQGSADKMKSNTRHMSSPAQPMPNAMTAEELEHSLRNRAPPPRTVSPIFGSPPSTALPIGTPPKPQFFQQAMHQQVQHQSPGQIPPHVLHQMQQQLSRSGGRISPTQLNQMIQEGRASPLASHPLLSQHMSPGIPPPPHGSIFPRGKVPPHLAVRCDSSGQGRVSPPMMMGQSPPQFHRAPGMGGDGPPMSPYNRQQYNPQRTPYRNQDNRGYRQYDHRGRNNRNYNHSDRSNGSLHEYDNLMTQKEKDWIIKIQMMQLQSNNPYLDDYYYQTFVLKKRALEKQNSGVESENKGSDPEIIMPQPKQTEARQYKPAHFEGTLGTVSVASVNNPRKMINVRTPSQQEDDQNVGSKDLTVRKRAHLLLGIEKIYTLLLELDDLEKKALALPEDDKDIEQERQKLVNQIFNSLSVPNKLQTGQDNYFLQILSINKGRRLIGRVLPVLSSNQAASVVEALLYNINYFIKKDQQENNLLSVYLPLANIIRSSDLEKLVAFMTSFTSGANVVSSVHHGTSPVSSAVQNKFGISILCLLLCQGEHILSTQSPLDINADTEGAWNELVLKVGQELSSVPVENIAIPTESGSNSTVLEHFGRYVDKRTFLFLQNCIKSSKSSLIISPKVN
ncbi:LOW QUALITY PROTEIN: protein PAT1 homolog 1-like [Ptychodera flava]|uniref:LOW QUALITY PROTEIN: protein PAT1 homolog 1-like n=1 Tax=Ptychodera flava TaxID=63121 RepID=UPI00396A4CEA